MPSTSCGHAVPFESPRIDCNGSGTLEPAERCSAIILGSPCKRPASAGDVCDVHETASIQRRAALRDVWISADRQRVQESIAKNGTQVLLANKDGKFIVGTHHGRPDMRSLEQIEAQGRSGIALTFMPQEALYERDVLDPEEQATRDRRLNAITLLDLERYRVLEAIYVEGTTQEDAAEALGLHDRSALRRELVETIAVLELLARPTWVGCSKADLRVLCALAPQLDDVIDALGPELHAVINARCVKGLTIDETADALDAHPQADSQT